MRCEPCGTFRDSAVRRGHRVRQNLVGPAAALLLVISSCVIVGCTATSCSCNYGNVDIETPQCVCACFSGYLQPHCLYTATDMVPMGFYINRSYVFFDSYRWASTLAWGLGITTAPAESVTFIYSRAVVGNLSYARFYLRGDYAQQFLWDFYSSHPWLANVSILSVWEEQLQLPTAGAVEPDTTPILYRSADSNIVITVLTVGWVIGAAAVAGCACCGDMLFTSNTEENVEAYRIAEEDYYQQTRTQTLQRQARNGAPPASSSSRAYDVVHVTSRPSPGKNPLGAPTYDGY